MLAEMIYGIGKRARYDAKLAGPKPIFKLGKGTDKSGLPYPGGSVWRTEAEARQFIAKMALTETRAVYGIEADWGRDTEQLPGEPFRRLLRHARIVRIDNPET
jgi:hypothetical protein